MAEARIEAAKAEANTLISEIENARASKRDKSMTDVVAGVKSSLTAIRGTPSTKVRRTLKGHFDKIYALDWSGDSQRILSASRDGKLLVWNAFTTNKLAAVTLKSAWVMTCAFEPNKGNIVACGGLDNLCSIYDIAASNTPTRPVKELAAHDGYISCCRFLDERNILTSSGDSTCIHWDITTGDVLTSFAEHSADVMSVSINPVDKNTFVSCSVDRSAKVWDIRSGKCVQTHTGHQHDINAVAFFPDGKAFATGSDDSTCRLFDMRSYGQINQFGNARITCGISSVALSRSGRLLFAGYDDGNCHAWDTLGTGDSPAFQLQHSTDKKKISSIGVSPTGDAVCTASWDMMIKIWA